MATKWYAFCNDQKAPHDMDPATGTYFSWQGERRDKHADAKNDADTHNKNAGHHAQVLSAAK
jgi:hypothetical protein